MTAQAEIAPRFVVYMSAAAFADAAFHGIDGVVENMVERAILAGSSRGHGSGRRVRLEGGYVARAVAVGLTAGGRRKLLVTRISETKDQRRRDQ